MICLHPLLLLTFGVQPVNAAGVATTLRLDQPQSNVPEGENITFTGRLTRNDTGAGVPNATVKIWDDDLIGDDLMASGTTDTNGYFSITWAAQPMDPTDRSVEVKATYDGSTTLASSVSTQYSVTVIEKKATTLALSASKTNPNEGENITFTGRLTRNDTGTGVASATVKIYDSDLLGDDLMASGTTDGNGYFSIVWSAVPMDPLGDRGVEAFAKYDGSTTLNSSQSSQVSITVLSKIATTLTMSASKTNPNEGENITFTGRLTRNDTGAGVPSATVKIYDSDVIGDDLMASGTTDGNGYFSIVWSAVPMDPLGDRGVEAFAKYDGSTTLNSSQSSQYAITVARSGIEVVDACWISNERVATEVEVGSDVQARVNIKAIGSISRTIKVMIKEDVAGGTARDYVEQSFLVSLEDNCTQALNIDWTPKMPSSGDVKGFFVEVWFNNAQVWEMPQNYPPRLTVTLAQFEYDWHIKEYTYAPTIMFDGYDDILTFWRPNPEQYFPVYWYFDDNNPQNNPYNYQKRDISGVQQPHVFTHYTRYEYRSQTYQAIQYWYYYVCNDWLNDHDHDWVLAMVLFDEREIPKYLWIQYHNFYSIYGWTEALKENDTHPILVAESGSHEFRLGTDDGLVLHYNNFVIKRDGEYPLEPAKFGSYDAPWKRCIWIFSQQTYLSLDPLPHSVNEDNIVLLTGQLIDGDTGEGIENANIYLYDSDTWPDSDDRLASGTTGANGYFAISWVSKPMDWFDRDVEVYAKFMGNAGFKESESSVSRVFIEEKPVTVDDFNLGSLQKAVGDLDFGTGIEFSDFTFRFTQTPEGGKELYFYENKLGSVEVTAMWNNEGQLTHLSGTGEAEKTVFSGSTRFVTVVPVGPIPIPVWVTVNYRILVGAEVSGNYQVGQTSNVAITPYLKGVVQAYLYDIVGPEGTIKPYLRVQYYSENNSWLVFAGVQAELNFNALGRTIWDTSVEREVLLYPR